MPAAVAMLTHGMVPEFCFHIIGIRLLLHPAFNKKLSLSAAHFSIKCYGVLSGVHAKEQPLCSKLACFYAGLLKQLRSQPLSAHIPRYEKPQQVKICMLLAQWARFKQAECNKFLFAEGPYARLSSRMRFSGNRGQGKPCLPRSSSVCIFAGSAPIHSARAATSAPTPCAQKQKQLYGKLRS